MGTIVKEGDQVVADLSHPGDEYVAALGGAGGKGNRFFLANDNRAPLTCTPGEPGQERVLSLELKTVAHAGLVGVPGARGGRAEGHRCPGLGRPPACRRAAAPLPRPAVPLGGARPGDPPRPRSGTDGGGGSASPCPTGRVPQRRQVLAAPGHFERKARRGRVPVHDLEPARRHRAL